MKIEQLILKKLEKIEKDLKQIKEHMVDPDTVLTPEEEVLLEQSFREEKEGKTIPLAKLKKELGLR